MNEIRVLFVDDGKDLTPLLDMLGKGDHGRYRVTRASGGGETIEKMRPGEHDICLVSSDLGSSTGLDLIREARHRGCGDIPLIFVTNDGKGKAGKEAMGMGAADYLDRKEITKGLLERAIRYALNQKKAEIKLREMSLKDGLTGLVNRRYFDEQFEKEWRKAYRDELELSLILIDIDFFKLFNDRYGYIEGDTCLQGVCAAVAGCVNRPGDLAARFGGEEIAVLLPETDFDNAQRLAEEMRKAVLSLGIPNEDSRVEGCNVVSVSGGIATMTSRRFDSAAELLKEAENALFLAKEMGRNRMETV